MNEHLPPILRDILNRFCEVLSPEGMQERDEKLRENARQEWIDEQRERDDRDPRGRP